MKLIIFLLSALFLKIATCNCQTNSLYLTSIKAGQDSGCGIKYFDIVPDDTLRISPLGNLMADQSYDIDGNDTVDFKITCMTSDIYMLGSGYTYFYITPFSGNAVCVSGYTNIADSLRYNDIIDSNRTWSNSNAYFYYYQWVFGQPTTTYGYWTNQSYYVGIRIKSGTNQLYG
jgi:hypothetical protein